MKKTIILKKVDDTEIEYTITEMPTKGLTLLMKILTSALSKSMTNETVRNSMEGMKLILQQSGKNIDVKNLINDSNFKFLVTVAITEFSDELFPTIEAFSGVPAEVVENLKLESTVRLIATVIELNNFVELIESIKNYVGPLIQNTLQKYQKK